MPKIICPKCGTVKHEILKTLEVVCRYDEATDEYLPIEDRDICLVVECIDCKTEIEEF
jgi:hypothetical protein